MARFSSVTDYGCLVRKSPWLHSRNATPTSKFLAKAYFVCHIGPNFQISLICAFIGCPLDTGHFFNTSLIQGLVFKGIVKGQESKVWAFFKGLRSFRGPQKQNWKNDQNSIIFGAKIKVRINFIWEKLMEFLLLNEVLKNWIFFQLPIQKSDFITLIFSKFSILNANLWSIYSKRFEFMVYTCFCAFWKIKIFWLLRPSKSSGALKKVPAFGFLTFEYAFKN